MRHAMGRMTVFLSDGDHMQILADTPSWRGTASYGAALAPGHLNGSNTTSQRISLHCSILPS